MQALLLILALSAPALAYLDPATGSLLVQFILAALAAVAVGFRRIKHWFLALMGKAPAQEEEAEEPSDDEDEDEATEEGDGEAEETE